MRKMDEMEWNINLKGIRWSYLFLILSLFIWGAYNYIKMKAISLPLILIIMQFVVYFFTTSIAKFNVDDKSGKKQSLMVIAVLLSVFIFGIIIYFTQGS